MADWVGSEECPECGSSDNLRRHADGHGYCFTQGCGYYEKGDMVEDGRSSSAIADGDSRTNDRLSVTGEYHSLNARKIKEETCKHFGYRVGEYAGRNVQLAYYYDENRVPVAAKVRFPPKPDGKKDFTFIGDPSKAPLYGQWLYRDGGKKVVITEGEIDCLTVAQVQGVKWPCVSVQNGAGGALKSVQKALEWLNRFDEVVICFDMDKPGREAAKACAAVLPVGKAKIVSLPEPFKDPNEMLQAGKVTELIDALWGAKTYRPDGIVDGSALWDALVAGEAVENVLYPWSGLNEKTRGLRIGELVTVTAGSGIGKTKFVNEIAYHLIRKDETIGMLMLEQNIKRTALELISIEANRPLHLDMSVITEAELKKHYDATIGTGKVFLYDHFGSTDVDNLLGKVRYMAQSLGCKWVILDHLSIVVSAMDEGTDERKLIDRAMTLLRTLVEETGIGLILVSHLKRPEGKGHEEGARTSLSQLRGSAAIAQLSDMVISLERDQQGENPNEVIVRVLKNRFSGDTGEACTLYYDKDTGRLVTKDEEPGFEDLTKTEDF